MIVNLKSQTDLSGFYVVYEGAANLEEKGQYGISHLIEHLMTTDLLSKGEKLVKSGVEFNAETSQNEVTFYLTGLEKNLARWREPLLRSLSKLNYSEDTFQTQKSVVLTEYSQDFSGLETTHFWNVSRDIFDVYGPLGLKKDLESLTLKQCLDCYSSRFAKPSKIINISKNFEYKDNSIQFDTQKAKKKIERGDYDAPLEMADFSDEMTSIICFSPIIEEDFAYVDFINSLLSDSLSFPLFREIRNKGLAYELSLNQRRINNQGISDLTVPVSKENVWKTIGTIRKVLNNPKRLFTERRIDAVKSSLKAQQEKEEILRFMCVEEYIDPPEWNVYSILPEVNLDRIKEVYDKYFDFDAWHTSYCPSD
ncbi:MAG TPA: insulinase family protein [Candidatus Pacearchaeota archaeon]|nr:insulinase family protein [Candidatus Pacearchaeota archaeon]